MSPRKKGVEKSVFSDETANRYDAWFAMPSGRYALTLEHELLLDLVPDWKNSRVLDVGCGTANQLLLFREKGAAFGVGVDISEDMLRFAQEKIRARGAQPLFLLRARAEALPFKKNSFKRITSITALEFFREPAKAVAEMRRLDASEYLIAVLNSWSLSSQWRRLKSYFSRTIFQAATFYSPVSLRNLFKQNGFSSSDWRFRWRTTLQFFPVFFQFLEPLFRTADFLLTRLHSPFGAFLVLKIEKRERIA